MLLMSFLLFTLLAGVRSRDLDKLTPTCTYCVALHVVNISLYIVNTEQ